MHAETACSTSALPSKNIHLLAFEQHEVHLLTISHSWLTVIIFLFLKLLSATTAGMAASMQGWVYVFATRALPKLTEEEDLEMRLSKQEASWFGEFNMDVFQTLDFICNLRVKSHSSDFSDNK